MNFESLSVYIANLPLLREQAYLDPGSGSFLIQLLIAGLVGAGFAIKMSWKKIKRLFNRITGRPEVEEPGTETPDEPDQQS